MRSTAISTKPFSRVQDRVLTFESWCMGTGTDEVSDLSSLGH